MTDPAAIRTRLAALSADAGDGGTRGERREEPSRAALDLRRRAVAAAATAYGAAHGHPTEAATRGRTRWAVSRRAATAAVLGLALLAGIVVLRTLPREPAVTVELDPLPGAVEPGGESAAAPAAMPGPTAVPGPTTVPATEIVVHVVGEVASPGVVRLPAGSRVTDALDAAGGATGSADLAALNLARTLTDGEQVRVPAPGEAGAVPGSPGGSAPPGGPAAPLDLNAATAADLDALPGIGPVLAERIVAWRTANGRFSRVAELTEVSGIGPALLADLEPLVTVPG